MFRRLMTVALVLSASFSGISAHAEDGHQLSSMKGDLGIDLRVYDHAMGGAIRDFVIWGSVNEKEGTSELIMRRDGQDVKTIFRQIEKSFGGTVEHRSQFGQRTTSVQFASLDKQKNEYTFMVNGEPVKAIVTSEDFKNNHFIKPTYSVVSKNGQTFSFKFDGEACYKYSLHILTMMIAATTH